MVVESTFESLGGISRENFKLAMLDALSGAIPEDYAQGSRYDDRDAVSVVVAAFAQTIASSITFELGFGVTGRMFGFEDVRSGMYQNMSDPMPARRQLINSISSIACGSGSGCEVSIGNVFTTDLTSGRRRLQTDSIKADFVVESSSDIATAFLNSTTFVASLVTDINEHCDLHCAFRVDGETMSMSPPSITTSIAYYLVSDTDDIAVSAASVVEDKGALTLAMQKYAVGTLEVTSAGCSNCQFVRDNQSLPTNWIVFLILTAVTALWCAGILMYIQITQGDLLSRLKGVVFHMRWANLDSAAKAAGGAAGAAGSNGAMSNPMYASKMRGAEENGKKGRRGKVENPMGSLEMGLVDSSDEDEEKGAED
jgi:hypothetical protein